MCLLNFTKMKCSVFELDTFGGVIKYREYVYTLKRTLTFPLTLLLWMTIFRCASVALSVALFSFKNFLHNFYGKKFQ